MTAGSRSALLAAVLLLAGCATPSAPAGLPSGPVTVGLITSLSGIDLPLGADLRLGAQQAVDEVNAAGGVGGHAARLAVADDAGSAQQATSSYTALVKGGVAGVIGPLAPGAAAAVAAAAASRRTPLLSTAGGDPAAAGAHPASSVFLAAPSASRSAERMLDYARSASLTRVAVAHPTGDELADAGIAALRSQASRFGVTIAVDLPLDPGAVDFKPVIDGVRASGANLLLVWGRGAGPPQLERAWRVSGLTAPILLSPGSATTAFLRAVSDSGEGALVETTQSVLAQALPTSSSAYRQVAPMAAAFERRNGYWPTQAAFDGYAGARLLLKAISAANSTDPAAIDAKLADLKLATAAGTFSFGAGDHLGLQESWLVVATIRGGRLAPLS